MKVFDSKEPVVYHKNTGYFEDWTAKDNTQLGGVSIEFPYRGDSTELWEDYLELYRKIDPSSNSWRNFMGSYTAIRSAGQVLMDIHTGKYTTEETSVAAIEQKLGASLEAFAVNTEMAANIKSKAPKALYDNRITAMDLNVINLGDYYYSTIVSRKHGKTMESVSCETGSIVEKGDIIPTGSAIRVTVTGKGNYTGTISTTYRLLKSTEQISKATFKIKAARYTGSPVYITDAEQFETDEKGNIQAYIIVGKTKKYLTLGEDFEIIKSSYVNNTKAGTASVTIHGIGDYGGYKTINFKIGTCPIR